MILTLAGLFLSFIGSIILIVNSFLSFGRESTIVIPSKYDENGKPKEFVREARNWKTGKYERVTISREELIIIISLFLITLGFFLQILDLLIPIYKSL